MPTDEMDAKFRRDTITEIDREYGRAKERERIVAVIQREIRIHEELADKYSRRNNIPGWQTEMYAAQLLARALSKITNG